MGAEFKGKDVKFIEPLLTGALYTDLERDIQRLKEFAAPLKREVIVSPLMPVIKSIMDLPRDLLGLNREELHEIEENVKEYERELDEISYKYISQIITHPEESKVFKILANANVFSGKLKSAIGKEITLEGGEVITITPKLVEALTRFKFSIGTPPVTPKGIETIERIMFGGDLKNIYEFRDLLEIDRVKFDRFITNVERLVDESTHYTTASEKGEFEREAVDFQNMEGLRGFTKTVISGTAKTATRLISDQLLSKYKDKSIALEIVDGIDDFSDELITKMNAKKEALFVVRVSEVPHHIFTDDKLKDKWRGIIGRLILVDDSEDARRSDTTFAYSVNSDITSTLAKLHVKDSGTPANTQINLRRIIENFSNKDLGQFQKEVDNKIAELEKEGVHNLPASEVRKKNWLITAQKDYFSLKKFQKFLKLIIDLKNANPQELQKMNDELREEASSSTMDYFFKEIKEKGYDCISVPQGGGRRQIGIIGDFHLKKRKELLDEFRQNGLARTKEKFEKLKFAKGKKHINDEEENALQRALKEQESPLAALQGDVGNHSRIVQQTKERAINILYRGSQNMEEAAGKMEERIDGVTKANISGELRVRVQRLAKEAGIGTVVKKAERYPLRQAGNALRGVQGILNRTGAIFIDSVKDSALAVKRRLEEPSLDFAEKMINDIENGTFQSSLALAEVGWTFNDVLDPDDFPTKNYIKISVSEDGHLDIDSLETQIEKVREELHYFPELFDIYCANIILIINDPHNPTSKVMPRKSKLKLLEIASKYNIKILSDEAYRKQVDTDIKNLEGDVSLAEFVDQNKHAFKNPIKIYTSFPTTKWAMGAGRRSGVIATNDNEFRNFAEDQIDGVHNMSLYMDIETIKMGQSVKKVCKELEIFSLIGNLPKLSNWKLTTVTGIMDKLLDDPNLRPVRFQLMEARNELDILRICGAGEHDYRQYIDNFISNLKDFRLDKQTQRDSAKRAKAVKKAVDEVDKEYPGIADRTVYPDGPFYFLVKLDDNGLSPSLQPFLETIARARNISVVPQSKGYVRFAFGGMLDGTDEGYALLSKAISTDLRLLLKYWGEFKTKKEELDKKGDLNPVRNALIELFPGGEREFVQSYEDKKGLLAAMDKHKGKRRKKTAYDTDAATMKYISKIEPDSATRVITLKNIKRQTTEEFVDSEPFMDLFDAFLIEVKNEVPALQHLSDEDACAFYGARQFAKKFKGRLLKNAESKEFAEIVIAIANKWFNQDTVKILSKHYITGDTEQHGGDIMSIEVNLTRNIENFIMAFTTEEERKQIHYRASLQAGYSAVKNVEANKNLPEWLQRIIGNFEFASETIPTDPSPKMKTPGKARVPGFDRGIFRRDGNGKKAPTAKYFSDKLNKFSKLADSKDYVCKMVQAGGVRVMLVMNRAYSHYLVEELRLFPQIQLMDVDAKSMRPDAVSFLGIPPKVMGEDHRIGYFIDESEDGEELPVSWVDKENITDYMGYLKKTILTVANEKVNEKEGLAIHGSAVTVVFRDGLRKTMVMAGDSGTGKSETIIAMVEQMINSVGTAKDVESIELLAGDMLSLYVGNDGQVYMLGTETGDFMRMSDIPDDWQKRFRDLIERGSKTNLDDKDNPRITISGLCKPENVLSLTRVNMFININNFELPPDGVAFVETQVPKNLIFGDYVKGYRGEKGTSGDQPNIYASVKHSKQEDKERNLKKHKGRLDELLSWEIFQDDIGKAKNAIMSFRKVDGEVFPANRMVQDLFLGKSLQYKGKDCKIVDTRYGVHENQYFVTLKAEDGENEEIPLYRNEVFNKIYNPIASTYGGNPFMDPKKVRKIFKTMADAMKEAGVITGTLYTQLKIDPQQGPALAAQKLINVLLHDDRNKERFTKHLEKVNKSLLEEYGEDILGQDDIPKQISAYNVYKLERFESNGIRLVGSGKKTIDLKTPYYKYDPQAMEKGFRPSLVTPDMEVAIKKICKNKKASMNNLENYDPDVLGYMAKIKTWKSKEELIYQILLLNGIFKLGYTDEIVERQAREVKKAEKAAGKLIILKKIKKICDSNENEGIEKELSTEEKEKLDTKIQKYTEKIDIKHYKSKEELIYNVLSLDGVFEGGYTEEIVEKYESEVKTAEKIAEKIATIIMAAEEERKKKIAA
jgi:hypothetical protein